MSSDNCPALKLELVPSRIIFVGLVACHLLALIATGLLVLPPAYKFGLAGLIVMSLIHTYKQFQSAHKRWFICEICSGDGEWLLRTATGESKSSRLSAAFVHPWLIILRFSSDTVVIALDSTEGAQLRRLRMHLLVSKDEKTGVDRRRDLGKRVSK